MKNHPRDFVERSSRADPDAPPGREQRAVRHFFERLHVSRNVEREFEGAPTLGRRVADRATAFGGSWTLHPNLRRGPPPASRV